VGFEVGDLPERAGLNDGFGGEDVAVPAAVLEDGENAVVLAGECDQLPCLGEIEGERLVDDDVLASFDGGFSKREVAVVGTGDDDEIEAGMGGCLRGRENLDFGEVSEDTLGPAGAYDGEFESVSGAEQGSVEGLASVAVPNEASADGGLEMVCHVI
jgi:hypothetical protein